MCLLSLPTDDFNFPGIIFLGFGYWFGCWYVLFVFIQHLFAYFTHESKYFIVRSK